MCTSSPLVPCLANQYCTLEARAKSTPRVEPGLSLRRPSETRRPHTNCFPNLEETEKWWHTWQSNCLGNQSIKPVFAHTWHARISVEIFGTARWHSSQQSSLDHSCRARHVDSRCWPKQRCLSFDTSDSCDFV